jgi:hypothetical protein
MLTRFYQIYALLFAHPFLRAWHELLFQLSLRIQAIHLEFNEMNIISKQSFKDFWDLLDAYDFYRILPGGKLLPIRVYKPISCELFAFQNLILILKPKF